MLKTPLFQIVLWVAVAIGVFDAVSRKLHLYYDFWWLDKVIHFGCGFWIAIAVVWFFFFSNLFIPHKTSLLKVTLLTLGVTAIIGTVWEIYEYVFNIAVDNPADYVFDTVTDFIADFSGAAAATLVIVRKHHDALF